jgi:phosphoribosyl-ATP pyrophosphohydrolase/phosphoribosyl-AMP cyclohydrolase
MTPDALKFDADGLIPPVVQAAETGECRMVAWMNREAVEQTLATGVTHFWSRSRGTPWRKGETSGHTQHVQRIYVDCDGDTLLVQVHQDGVACHTGHRTCFFQRLREEGANGGDDAAAGAADGAVDSPAATMLDRIERIVAERKVAAPAGSYVAKLLAGGQAAVARKIGEEAVEVVTAALGGEGDRRVVEEVADLWFHTLVLLGQRAIPLRGVLEELARRHAGRDGAAG